MKKIAALFLVLAFAAPASAHIFGDCIGCEISPF